VGWIVVELGFVRQFSALQVIYALAGASLIMLGDRAVLARAASAISALPMFLTAPLFRRRHLRWGATDEEFRAGMPGDALVPGPHFKATRALTIDAPPEQVWPWLMQVGYGRAGFYSYDFLDNLGRPSADVILPDWQTNAVGSVTAPMANPPTVETSFVVAELDPGRSVVWSKPDSTWTWLLTPLPGDRTRLVTRLKQRYRLGLGLPVTVILAEFGDFPMMRKMLLGIKRRAEATAPAPALEHVNQTPARTAAP
jgi:hypothetical protein